MIIKNGILGKGTKKIGSVVGATWKNINYLRTWVAPSNPKTAGQTNQRNAFKACVALVKGLVGEVLNVYVDPFLKGMSGYNYAIKQSLTVWTGTGFTFSNLKISWGKLFPPVISAAVYTKSTGSIRVDWTAEIGSNGKTGDKVKIAVYDELQAKWFFSSTVILRNTGNFAIALGVLNRVDKLHVYMFAADYVGSRLIKVSETSYRAPTYVA